MKDKELNEIRVWCPQFCLVWDSSSGLTLWRENKEIPVKAKVKDEWDVMKVAEYLRERDGFVVVTEKFGEIPVPELKKEFDLSHWTEIVMFYTNFAVRFVDGIPEGWMYEDLDDSEAIENFLSIQGEPVWDGELLVGMKIEVFEREVVVSSAKSWSIRVLEDYLRSFETTAKALRKILKSVKGEEDEIVCNCNSKGSC